MNVNQKKTTYNPDTIDLAKMAKVLWKKAWLIGIVALLFSVIAYLGTKSFITPTYQSSFTAYVNNKTEQEATSLTSSDITAARSLVSTYSAILVSRTLLEDAAVQAGLPMAYGELSGAVTTSIVDDTEIIRVNVTMAEPENAKIFADALAELAPAYIAKIVEGSSMQVIETPVLPTSIYAPDYLRNTGKGFILGAFLVVAVIVTKELLDNRVKGENELESRYGIAVMGIIPDLREAKKYSHGQNYGKSR